MFLTALKRTWFHPSQASQEISWAVSVEGGEAAVQGGGRDGNGGDDTAAALRYLVATKAREIVVRILRAFDVMNQPCGLTASAARSCWRLSLLAIVLGFDQFPVLAVAAFVSGPAATPVLLVLDT